MPRIFKGSESELRLLLSRSQETLTDIKIKLYTTNLEDAIEVIDGIAVEGDTAVISLAPRAFIGMEDGVVNYIVEAKVEGQSYYMERQSNYMLRSLSYINESGVASTTLEITQNGDYRVTPNDGLYVDIDVNVPVPVILDKDTLTLKSGDSGVYTTPQNYDAVKTLEYDVLPPNILGTDKITIKAGEKKTYTAPDEYDGVESLTIEAVPNQDMEVTITDNGEYTYMSDTDYSGIGVFKANVEVPIQEKAEVFNDNGDYTIVPDENYVAMRRINVKVDYKPKPVIPNGITLSGSTFSTIDMSNWNWSRVYDWSSMFADCSNLETIENFPSDVEVLNTFNMFKSCVKLTTAPPLDTSKLTDISFLFDGCSGLTSVELSGTSNITNTNGLFRDCKSLTTIPQFDTSNVTTMSQMFSSCSKLTTIPPLDTSNVTNMGEAFYECSKLTSVPQLNTSKVKAMNNLFRGCGNLISVGGIDTSSATTMSYMFNSCSKLQEVRFTGNPINLTNVSSMTLGISRTGTLYYPAEYADAYQIIINAFPTNWVKVPE